MYKRLLENKRAAIFDFDGTIADTEEMWTTALVTVLKRAGAQFVDTSTTSGMYMPDRVAHLVETYNIDTPLTIKDLVEEVHTEFLKQVHEKGVSERPGLWELLLELKEEKKLKVGLATSSHKNVIMQLLTMLELEDQFEAMVFGDEVQKPKPHPEIYLKTAQMLEVKPQEVLVFEDSLAGTKAAIKAKMDVVVIWNGGWPQHKYPKEVRGFIPDFSQLPGRLDRTFDEEFDAYISEIERLKAEGVQVT